VERNDGEGDVACCGWRVADRGAWPRDPEAAAPLLSEVRPIRGESTSLDVGSASSDVPPQGTRDNRRISAPFALISAPFCTEFLSAC
jgi:hypothetical protein